MINGIVSFDSGDILYKGKSLKSMTNKELRSTRKNLAYIFQNSNLLDNKSVYYHLSLVYKLNNVNVNNKRVLTPLQRMFKREKEALDQLLNRLYNLGVDDSLIPYIKDLYEAH